MSPKDLSKSFLPVNGVFTILAVVISATAGGSVWATKLTYDVAQMKDDMRDVKQGMKNAGLLAGGSPGAHAFIVTNRNVGIGGQVNPDVRLTVRPGEFAPISSAEASTR